MCDVEENSKDTLEHVKLKHNVLHPEAPFDNLTSAEKWDLIHERKRDALMHVWTSVVDDFLTRDIELLRVDITDCQYLSGCCRLGVEVMELLDFDGYKTYPKRIEIVGALARECDEFRAAIEDRNHLSKDCISFVDRPGCICTKESSDGCMFLSPC